MARTKKNPTSSTAKKIDAGLPMDTPKRSGSSVAPAVAGFSATEIGEAILADPLFVDCYWAVCAEGWVQPLGDVILWQAKQSLMRSHPDSPALLNWDDKKQDFSPSPRLDAYRARRRKADAEPVIPRDGWDEAFAELIIDVVKERVRKAERCPAARA